MKKIAHIFSFILAILTTKGYAALDPTTYPDVVAIPAPIITLRSLATGEPVSNEHYGERDARHFHWRLLDAHTNKFKRTRDNGTLVQFQALDTDKCYGFYSVLDCTDQNRTTFSLIPTNTGAFIIKDVELGFCLVSATYGDYNLVPCGQASGERFDVRFLWILAPAFGQTKILQSLQN